MQDYLLDWVECTNNIADPSHSFSLHTHLSNIFSTGTELLFTLEIFRQSHPSSLLPTLKEHIQKHSAVVLRSLPRLFISYIAFVRKHRGLLFGQSSGASGAPSSIAQQMKEVALEFFASCLEIIEESANGGTSEEVMYGVRLDLLKIVDREMLMTTGLESDAEAERIFKKIAGSAAETLAPSGQGNDGTNNTRLSLKTLSTLTRIDYKLVESSVPSILLKLPFVSGLTGYVLLVMMNLPYGLDDRAIRSYRTS